MENKPKQQLNHVIKWVSGLSLSSILFSFSPFSLADNPPPGPSPNMSTGGAMMPPQQGAPQPNNNLPHNQPMFPGVAGQQQGNMPNGPMMPPNNNPQAGNMPPSSASGPTPASPGDFPPGNRMPGNGQQTNMPNGSMMMPPNGPQQGNGSPDEAKMPPAPPPPPAAPPPPSMMSPSGTPSTHPFPNPRSINTPSTTSSPDNQATN